VLEKTGLGIVEVDTVTDDRAGPAERWRPKG
jgi:hypothetical protein